MYKLLVLLVLWLTQPVFAETITEFDYLNKNDSDYSSLLSTSDGNELWEFKYSDTESWSVTSTWWASQTWAVETWAITDSWISAVDTDIWIDVENESVETWSTSSSRKPNKKYLSKSIFDYTSAFLAENDSLRIKYLWDTTDNYLKQHPQRLTESDFESFSSLSTLEENYALFWYESLNNLLADLLLEQTYDEPVSYEGVFRDIWVDDYKEAIYFVSSSKIVEWYKDWTYKPNNPINRAELTKIVMEALYPWFNPSIKQCFPDVPKWIWYEKYVCWAKEKKIINGFTDWKFKPWRFITEAETLKILFRAMWDEIFDSDAWSWYTNYVNRWKEFKLFNSVPLDPNSEITRWQMAEFIYLTSNHLNSKSNKNYKIAKLIKSIKTMNDSEKQQIITDNLANSNKLRNLILANKIKELKANRIYIQLLTLSFEKRDSLLQEIKIQENNLPMSKKIKINYLKETYEN